MDELTKGVFDSQFMQVNQIHDREEFDYFFIKLIDLSEKHNLKISKLEAQEYLERKFNKKFTEYEHREVKDKKDELDLSKEIVWLDDDYFDNWSKTKGKCINLLRKENTESEHKLFFLAHSKDEIIGKPQQINETLQHIPLIIKVGKKNEDDGIDISYKFIDDRFDKRYDGYEIQSLDKKFYVYRVVDKDHEYLAFSETKLDQQLYTLRGMKIKMPCLSELTKALKIRSLSTVFLIKEAHSTIKVLDKKELIKMTKTLNQEIGLDQEAFKNLTFLHPDGKVYLRSEHYNLIRIAQLLSGKEEGYPLHVLNIGPIGKGKTKELEALDYKFQEPKGILEAGNSTPKVLIPSFKEKPASPGYILSTIRLSLIDELMKMIANANINGRSGEAIQEHLSQLNMLLEHKKRTIGSGNDNALIAKATSKVIFGANPLPSKRYLGDHIGIVDGSTLSRMLCVVQDYEEQDFIEKNIPFDLEEHTKSTGYTYASIYTKGGGGLYYYNDVSSNIYIQIYDSCQEFIVNYDKERVREIFKTSVNMTEEPMKTIWKARGLHHTILLLDGLTKYRCLFKDFDENFTATDYDYIVLEVLLSKIVNSWKVDLSMKTNQSDNYKRGILV